ncbi:PPK2 family polyphosphate kinase [Rhodococcus aerolatus]
MAPAVGVGEATAALQVEPGTCPDLASFDCRATPVGPRRKSAGAAALDGLAGELDHLHRALWAQEGRARASADPGDGRRVLVVLQGVDTAGKGGAVRHLSRLLDPQGVRVAAFGRPTAAELEHHYLWRVRRGLPGPGQVGVFDRSHYEDVLVPRVEQLVAPAVWDARHDEVNDFEAELVASGTTVLKVLLALSPEEQKARLLARLDDPEAQWKYSPDDLAARARWSSYRDAYTDVVTRCGTVAAPWHVVPADRKWYRTWAVAALLRDALAHLEPRFPAPTYDVAAARAALTTADPLA